jgi:hypothetical protein
MDRLRFADRIAGAAPQNRNGVPPIRGIFEQCYSAAIIRPSMRQATLLSTSTGGYSSRQTAGDAARQTRRTNDVIKTSPSNTLSRTLPFKVVAPRSALPLDVRNWR